MEIQTEYKPSWSIIESNKVINVRTTREDKEMKLIIKRGRQVEQRNYLGASNGVTFSLYCKVLLDEVEQILAHKYNVDQYTLSMLKCGSGGSMQVVGLLSGVTFHHTEMKTLLENEQAIKEACEELKSLLQVMALVGDEEVIEF